MVSFYPKKNNYNMKLVLHIDLFLFLCSYSLMAQPPLKVKPISNAPEGFDRLFSKQVDIFGFAIFATRRTPDPKLLHAAGLLAQYLDNDNDGHPDNELVIKAIHKSKGTVLMSATKREAEKIDVHCPMERGICTCPYLGYRLPVCTGSICHIPNFHVYRHYTFERILPLLLPLLPLTPRISTH